MNLQMHKPLLKTTICSVEKRVSKTNLSEGKGVLDASLAVHPMRGLQYHGESFVKTHQDQSIVNMQPVMKTQVLKAISINFCL